MSACSLYKLLSSEAAVKRFIYVFCVVVVAFLFWSGADIAAQMPKLPVMSADIVIERTFNVNDPNGSKQRSVGKFYRDSEGRTRIDQDGLTAITDPVAGVGILLNSQGRTALTTTLGELPASPNQSGAWATRTIQQENPAPRGGPVLEDSDATLPSVVSELPHSFGDTENLAAEAILQESSDLGSRAIDGWEATGVRVVVTLPGEVFQVDENIVQTFEIWHSERLGIPLVSTVENSLSSTRIVTRYTNIQENPSIDPTLFEIPEGFRLVGP